MSISLPHSNLVTLAFFYPNRSIREWARMLGQKGPNFAGWNEAIEKEFGIKDAIKFSGGGRSVTGVVNEKAFFALLFDYLKNENVLLTQDHRNRLMKIYSNPDFRELLAASLIKDLRTARESIIERFHMSAALWLNVFVSYCNRKGGPRCDPKTVENVLATFNLVIPKDVRPKFKEVVSNPKFHKEFISFINPEFVSVISKPLEKIPFLWWAAQFVRGVGARV